MTDQEKAAARRAAYNAVLKDAAPMNFKRPQPGDKTMTEPSEAANRLARELLEDGLSGGWVDAPTALSALARVLQDHSDAAQAAQECPHCGFGNYDRLQSLILPEEPCQHEIDVRMIDFMWASPNDAKRCIKCGQRLKLVEAGDD